MKKIIQLALVVLLVCVVFQTVGDGSMASASNAGSNLINGTLLVEKTSEADVHMAACLVRIKGVICISPNVGWNT
jgi:hypothetical protein